MKILPKTQANASETGEVFSCLSLLRKGVLQGPGHAGGGGSQLPRMPRVLLPGDTRPLFSYVWAPPKLSTRLLWVTALGSPTPALSFSAGPEVSLGGSHRVVQGQAALPEPAMDSVSHAQGLCLGISSRNLRHVCARCPRGLGGQSLFTWLLLM